MQEYSEEHVFKPDEQPTGSPERPRRKQPMQQARQLLSCTKCRERKVKCDRTKPCSACCARGQPKECHFKAEAGDYAPIQQSYELRKLRAENLRLKERLRAGRISIEEDDSDIALSPDSQFGERPSSSQKPRAAKRKRFQGSEWQDSIYFGSPGLTCVVADFANVNINPTSASLAHVLPRGCDMFTPKNPTPYPFPTLFAATPEECIPRLLGCLPGGGELFKHLTAFEERVSVCSFPYVPFEITKAEVDRFLGDAAKNAHMCPDMLALLFAAIALGSQHSVWDRSGDRWEAGAMYQENKRGDIYIAAAMQALRLASFMHKPTLMGIQALVMIGPYLTNSGRFLDAWTLFGTTIRLAQSIGLHRHPKHLNPVPPTQRECSVRQTLWWWMLHMDEQYSMTLGRPLGISGIGDCPPALELTTDRQMLRFGDFVNHFTVLARRSLSSDLLNTTKIDELTDEFRSLLETMPEALQFDASWLEEGRELPEWPLNAMAAVYYCKTHTYIILLNRQRFDKPTVLPYSLLGSAPAPAFRAVNRITPPSQASPTAEAPLRGRPLVIASSASILDAFIYLYLRVPAALVSWTLGQQAFNACMILLLDAIELREVTSSIANVEKAYAVFQLLQGVHTLASLAIERISWGLKELHDVTQLPSRPDNTEGLHGARSEASNAMCGDAVMDATGMLLLEDPGLQGFAPEAFAPINWNFGEDETVTLGFPSKQEQNLFGSITPSGSSHLESPYPGDESDDHRSAAAMQGMRRSTTMRSAPTRYATPTMDESQPAGGTIPTLRARLAPSNTNQQSRAPGALFDDNIQPALYPPHLRHTHLRDNHNPWEHSLMAFASDTAPGLDARKFQRLDQGLGAQMRHNSCPSIPQVSAASRDTQATRARPSVISDQGPFREVVSPQSPWPEGNAMSFQMAEPALHSSRPPRIDADMADVMHALPGDVRQTTASYAMHFSGATSAAAEDEPGGEWRRWM